MASADYVIVGGGSAGATLAARLSEDPAASVLLLEAGLDYRAAATPEEFTTRNLAMGRSERNPDFYWGGLTARRNRHQQALPYSRGRGLGGSSTINGLCAIRGVPEDFDAWAAEGADGWGWADVLPAFVRLEDDLDFPDADHHGSGGPIPVYREREEGWGGVDRALRDAALNHGHGWHADHNAPGATGVSPFAMNIRDGRRVSTNDAYLEPARERPNLTILGGCHVDRVLFDGDRAVGVRCAGGATHRVDPGGEVILAAGAVHSPAILLRSGVGPAGLLGRVGIDVREELPVGRNLQDHAIVFVELPVDPAAQRSVGDRPTNTVVRYSSGAPGAGENDLMLLASNHNYWFGKPSGGVAIQLNACHSRGRLEIPSDDPLAHPQIDIGLLDDERDLQRMAAGLEHVHELLGHRAFAAIRTGEAIAPRADELHLAVKDVMHVCGTARMGAPDDPRSVVDADCRVLGVEGLRVIDASVMPNVPRANTNLTVIMIAEHMAVRMGAVAPPPDAVTVGEG